MGSRALIIASENAHIIILTLSLPQELNKDHQAQFSEQFCFYAFRVKLEISTFQTYYHRSSIISKLGILNYIKTAICLEKLEHHPRQHMFLRDIPQEENNSFIYLFFLVRFLGPWYKSQYNGRFQQFMNLHLAMNIGDDHICCKSQA